MKYGEKMARNGHTKDIYKRTFICIQTLVDLQPFFLKNSWKVHKKTESHKNTSRHKKVETIQNRAIGL